MSKIRRYTLKQASRPQKQYRVRYAEELNSEQYEVVMAGEGPMLVIAGAGSGKTRALTYRVSRLIEDGIDPQDILLLTFTNKSSREMLARVEELVTIDTRRIWGGTFHSVASRLLRRHAEAIGYRSNFTILDSEDAKETMESAVSAVGIKTLEKRFPKGDVLLDIYSYVINTRTPLELELENNYPQFGIYRDEIVNVFRKYKERKREANAMDFDDLLLHWKLLLEDHADVAASLKRRFRFILVDEYQDTNKLQADIVDGMAAERRNVMVVGDDAQSIYSFRGASFENILTFPIRFPESRIYKLETNYRSTPQILRLANEAINNNRYQFRKELRAVRGDGPEPAVVGVDDVFEQASFVAQRILELRDEGESLAEIAVLYRSHYQSLELQMELSRRLIPYEIRSGVRFFEQAHVKDVLAYLKIVINPRDELSWKRTLKLYPKVGEKTAADVWGRIGPTPDPLDAFLNGRKGSAAKGTSSSARAIPASLENASKMLRLLSGEGMRRNPAESIQAIVEGGYADYARSRFPNAQARLDDLEQLGQYALRYEDVTAFLEEVALANPIAGEDSAVAGPDDEKVVLSSVHQAKGLEWRAVFVIWLADGRFPSQRALRVPGGIVRFEPARIHEAFELAHMLDGPAGGGLRPADGTPEAGLPLEVETTAEGAREFVPGNAESQPLSNAADSPGTATVRIEAALSSSAHQLPVMRAAPLPLKESDVPNARVGYETPPEQPRVAESESSSHHIEIVIPGEEEERRLFYVAVTRAKQELYLVFPVMSRDRGGLDVLMEPSRFIRELPTDLYEKWVIGEEP